MSSVLESKSEFVPLDALVEHLRESVKYYEQLADAVTGAGYDKGSFTGKAIGLDIAAAKLERALNAANSPLTPYGEAQSEARGLAELKLLLFQCLTELGYVQCVENCNSGLCATSMGKELIDKGKTLLGIPDLHERHEEQLRIALSATAPNRTREGEC